MTETNNLNPWVKASTFSYIIVAFLNFIIVMVKEGSKSGKDFFINFGKAFGMAHHLYGHIVFLLLIFIIIDVILVYTPLNDILGDIFKINNYDNVSFWVMISTAISALIILVYMFYIYTTEK